MISFACPGCSARYSVKDEFAGKKTRCKKCNGMIEIPQADTSDLDPPELGFLEETETRRSDVSNAAPLTSSPVTSQASRAGDSSSGDASVGGSSIYTAPASLSQSAARMPLRKDEGGAAFAPPPVPHATTIHNARPGTAAARVSVQTQALSRNNAGADNISGLLILLFLLAGIIGAVIAAVQYPGSAEYVEWLEKNNPDRAAAIQEVGRPIAMLVLLPVSMMVAAFAVLGPAVLLGWFISSKIFRAEMPQGVFMRCVGLAVLPWAIPMVIKVTRMDDTGILQVLCFIAAVPLSYAMLIFLHGERPGPAGVIMAFGGIFYAIACVISIMVIAAILAGPALTHEKKISTIISKRRADRMAAEMARHREEFERRYGITRSNNTAPSAPAVDPDAARRAGALSTIASYSSAIAHLNNRVASGVVREEFWGDLQSLRARILADEPRLNQYAEYAPVRAELASLEAKITALPSREPEPEVFTKITGAAPWDATPEMLDGFHPAMSILQHWSIRVPLEARMSLSGNPSESITWASPDQQVSLKITTLARSDAKQQRPWVVTPSMMTVAREKGIAHIIADNRTSATAAVNDLVITHAGRGKTQSEPIGVHTYMALSHDVWLIAEVRSRSDDPTWSGKFEAAIRTLRSRKSDEKLPDPLAPVFVAPRLAGAPADAAALLRKAGKSSEPYVLEIASTPDHPARVAAIEVLKDVGTAKSSELLWKLAYDPDASIRRAARTAVSKVDAKNAEPLRFVLEDLALPASPENVARRSEALDALATTAPDEARVESVAPVLETILLDAAQSELAPAAGRALSVWNRPKTADVLLPVLSNPKSEDHPNLDAVIRAAGGISDKRLPFQVVRWLTLRKQAVSDACATMGTPGEDELIKLLGTAPGARLDICEVLKRMGTSRSIPALEKAKRDKNGRFMVGYEIDRTIAAIREREGGN